MSSDEESDQPLDASSSHTIDDADDETIRIMLSTDNHLGYLEGDAVRGDDSFAALEEVLYLAKHYGCDLVLLSGDLFHENKPSRRTLHKAMTIFRKYCLGPNPISIQILSDQSRNFRQGQVNYQNEFYSVDLPVFGIHGNHDDPSREGSELYAALDLLDIANLVNYIGRQEEVNKVEIAPVLVKKKGTYLALYGLGSMRDERLNRMWQNSNVTFLRPSQHSTAGENPPEFFNLFALHQNRDKGRGTKNCVHEAMIPEWMDLVCWGHEHECCIEPHESVVGTFRITQPGSSVATSLVAGEAVTKHIGILDIRGQAFRLRPIPLTQVRTFVVGEISLQEQRNLDPDDPKIEQKVKQLLQEQVELLIHQAKRKRQELQTNAKQNSNVIALAAEHPLANKMAKPDEVLVRLKVEHSGFSVLNNQRFGAQFIGQVANPTDILLFQRKKTPPNKASSKKQKMEPIVPDQLEAMDISDFIVGELEQSDRKLELFEEKRIAAALEDYVQKQQAQALSEAVTSLLGKQQTKLMHRHPVDPRDDTSDKSAAPNKSEEQDPTSNNQTKGRKRTVSSPGREVENVENGSKSSRMEKQASVISPKSRHTTSQPARYSDIESDEPAQTTSRQSTGRSGRGRKPPVDDDDSDDYIEEVPPPKRPAPAPRRRRAAASKRRDVLSDDDSEEEDSEGAAPRNHKATRAKKSVSNTPLSLRSESRLSQSQLSFVPVKRSSNSRKRTLGKSASDEDETRKSSTYDLDEDWGTAKTDTFDT